jgi:hypothetical protein
MSDLRSAVGEVLDHLLLLQDELLGGGDLRGGALELRGRDEEAGLGGGRDGIGGGRGVGRRLGRRRREGGWGACGGGGGGLGEALVAEAIGLHGPALGDGDVLLVVILVIGFDRRGGGGSGGGHGWG